MNNIELKPCPFCGASKINIRIKAGLFYIAYCNNNMCGCSVAREMSEEKAIKKWNRRADDTEKEA